MLLSEGFKPLSFVILRKDRKIKQMSNQEEIKSITQDAAAKMAEYGITCIPVDYFHYKEFRYTNLADAISQAKRRNTGRNKTNPIL